MIRLLGVFLLTCTWVIAEPVLRAPEGFTVERVATPGVERSMLAGFDERGRLFVAESAGKNVDFKALAAKPVNFIRMLEDSDGDGVFDKSTIFADRMTFPAGALWHEGALYVASPPSLWKLEDTDGDGVCDRRSEIVTGFGSIGNGADLHGPYLGPDGWLYFCDGRNGHDVVLGDGSRWKGTAAAVYRCRTDGSGLEVVFGGGMDNPVAAAFTPEGELLVSCNLVMAHPQRQDAILFGIEGGVYPYAGCISEFRRSGDLLKPVGDLGWVAVSGMIRYEGTGLGDGFDSNLLSAQFNRHRVQRHTVTRDGAGFRITSTDFLTCSDPDFHPTDVLQDADGSVLVIDTGGWFRIGCPQSQVEKPSVLGGIYRVRRTAAPEIDDPRGLKLNWRDHGGVELVKRLGDARAAVSERAAHALASTDAGQAELEDLGVNRSGKIAITAVWVLSRRNTPAAREAVRRAIANADGAVRRTAIRAAGLARDQSAAAAILPCLAAKDLAEAREAALALGRIGQKTATAPLLAELNRASDPFHEHAIIYALIQIGDRAGVAAGLSNNSPAVQRGAMISLDQMRDGNLEADQIIPLLRSKYAPVRQEAMEIARTRPPWAGKLAEHLGASMASAPADEATQQALRGVIVAFAADAGVQKIVARALADDATPRAVKLMLLDAIAAAAVPALPASWQDAVGAALACADEALVRQAVQVVQARGLGQFDGELARIAHDGSRGTDLRVAALAAGAPRIKADGESFALLLAELAVDRPLLSRLTSAQCLARLTLDDRQLIAMATTAIPSAGPMEMTQLLAAFEKSSSSAVGLALVAGLERSKSASSLSGGSLRATLAKYPEDVKQAAQPLLARLDAAGAQQKARLAELEPLLAAGDPSRGQAVFLGKTAGCTTCHAIGGAGGQVGPDLSKIGAMRSGRDLLESIVFPSASIARGFEPFVVEMKDGKVYAGTIAGESAEAIRINTPAEQVIPRSQIKIMRPDRVSIMPQGLDGQLTRQELGDLVAFLVACK